MENIILKLIEIENIAGSVLKEAESGEGGETSCSIEQVCAEIENRINFETESKIVQMQKDAEEEIKQMTTEIENASHKKLDAIKRTYYENHEKVEEEIFNAVKRVKI